MQPESPASSTPVTPQTAPRENSPTSDQHGLPAHQDTGGIALSSDPDASRIGAASTHAATDEQLALDAAFAASLQETELEGGSQRRRLSPSESPSPPPPPPPPATPSHVQRNRIDEYEKASTPPVGRKREGPAFEVIKKQRAPGDKRSPIAELPNEILTHSLAHLAPGDLASVSLVSKRFHDLVTTPHAWRSAFARYFPGPDSIDALERDSDDETDVVIRSERRAFTRLTPLASWRSEYIMRTRLLRSLVRGKPVQVLTSPGSARTGQSHTAIREINYGSGLFTTINHIHAGFGTGLNKRFPRFIHGADDVGTATSSDPSAGKTDAWGLSDPQSFLQFFERFPGDAQYGLGPGEIVGVPNVMDVSQPYGMVHGEGSPGGMVYYRSTEELRGRFLLFSSAMSVPELGIPRISSTVEAVCSVWIAKSNAIPSLTDGLVGMLSGSSLGVLTAYSIGSSPNSNNRDQRYARGEMTARWVLSPGVPLIAIAVDNEHSLKRQAENRIWAVVLNALGEVFYLTKFPKRPHVERGARLDNESLERTAWLTGRSVYWNLVEPSRRVAKPDPYGEARVDGSYSPRSSWNGMCLSKEQISAETREIEAYADRKPREYRKTCLGWDMRRKLEVDFAADDANNAGEGVVVIGCGLDEDNVASVKRYTRCRFHEKNEAEPSAASIPPLTTASTETSSSPSIFGGFPAAAPAATDTGLVFSFDSLGRDFNQQDLGGSATPRPMTEEWRTSTFSLGHFKQVQVLASTIDCSTFATQTTSEDPLLGFSGRSTASSPSSTPLSPTNPVASPADVPGQRARLIAAGTHTGTVILWNMRAPTPKTADSINTVDPVRIIYTDSPQISCLALSSLCLVHGGNDGLVQVWDPLASDIHPIRTIHSRHASRARRRLAQAQASPQGVGINLYAAGAICLDPDPTVLRGIVSLGIQLRYWQYSSSAADEYKSSKRKLRRTERGSNNGGERFSGATRTNLKGYIDNEKFELEREKVQRKKDAQRMAGRFGTELLDGSEEDMMAYAAMLSQESHQLEQLRRDSDPATATDSSAITSTSESNSIWSSDTATPAQSPSPSTSHSKPAGDEDFDAEMAEAIRQSLAASSPGGGFDIPIRQAKPKGGRKGSSAFTSPKGSPMMAAGNSREKEMNDLDFAIQLSLAEEQSRGTDDGGDFPVLSRGGKAGKGKGRMV